MHRVECNSILRHLQYYYWCLFELWDNYFYPPCKECGIKNK